MRRAIAFLVIVVCVMRTSGQSTDGAAERHARIQELYSKQVYAEVIKEVEAQRFAVKGTAWEDSLYSYLYQYGRAYWKTKGAEAAAKAADALWNEVDQPGRAPVYKVKGQFNLQLLYYDLGMMAEYIRADSAALNIARQHKDRIPADLYVNVHYWMGLGYADIGDHPSALRLYDEAIALGQRIKPPPGLLLAKINGAAGSALRALGHLREAEAYFKRAMAAIENDTSLLALDRKAILLGNTGILIQNMGDLHRCKTYYYECVSTLNRVIARTKDKDPFRHDDAIMNRSRLYLNLATVYFSVMDIQRARELLQLARRDRVAVLGEDHPQVFQLNEAFAEVEAMSGDLDKAEELFREQILVTERSKGMQAHEYAMLNYKLARIVGKKKEYARADLIYASVIDRAWAAPEGATDQHLADALGDRATMRMEQGRYDEAIKDLFRAKTIRQNVSGVEHLKLAESNTLISNAALMKGDTATARQYADSALQGLQERIAIYKKPYAPAAFRNPYALADAIHAKVGAQRVAADPARAHEHLDLLDLAITSLHRNKAGLSDPSSRLLVIGSQKQLFDVALDVAFEAYQASHDMRDLDRFFGYTETDRSILLKNRLNDFSGLRFAGVSDTVLAREQQLLRDLRVDPQDRAAWHALHQKEQAYSAFLDTLRERNPAYFDLRYGEPRVALEDLRKRLVTADRDVLAYAVTKEHIYMLVVRTDTAVLIRTANKDLSGAVNTLHAAMTERDAQAYLHAAHAMYQMVFAPVAPLLTKTGLLIIADGELQKLNFETLLDAPSTRQDFRRHLLLQRYAIGYLLSATTALQFADLKQERPSKLLALAPGFTDEQKQAYVKQVKDTTRIDQHFLRYVRQPFAVRTAQGLGDRLSAKVLVGEQANEMEFRELARQYGVLHLGTHAELNEASPMYSRLVLSKNGSDIEADADGYLHAYEIYEMDLRAQLAVLTACETGAGKNDEGEGVRSLGYGFAYAGCPSLVMSLWNIDEKVSSEIITTFYEYLAQGMPKHEALRQAKLDHLANAPDELALPYYWAGLVLVGDVEPVKAFGPSFTWVWWAGGALLVVVLVLFAWRRRSSVRPSA